MAKTIKREKIWVDPSIVNIGYYHKHNIAYSGSFISRKRPENIKDLDTVCNKYHNNNDICFAGLLPNIARYKIRKHNRVYSTLYIPQVKKRPKNVRDWKCKDFVLDLKECNQWIQLTKEYKMLPSYIEPDRLKWLEKPKEIGKLYDKHTIIAQGMWIFDVSKLTQAQLYMYLSTLRYIGENPGLVRSILHLVNRRMNFYAAFVYSSKVALNGIGHSILTVYRNYNENYTYNSRGKTIYKKGSFEGLCNYTIPLSAAIGLRRFILDPSKYDKRSVYDGGRFNCQEVIEKISSVKADIALQDLFDPDIVSAIMSDSDKESNKFLKKFLNKKIEYISPKEKK